MILSTKKEIYPRRVTKVHEEEKTVRRGLRSNVNIEWHLTTINLFFVFLRDPSWTILFWSMNE